MDAGDEGSGAWNPSAAFGGFERESRVEEGVVPCREDLWKMFLGAAEDNVIYVSKEVDDRLDVWGEGGEGLGDALAHGKAERGCGKALTLEDSVSDGKGVPDAMAHVDIEVGWRALPHLCQGRGKG